MHFWSSYDQNFFLYYENSFNDWSLQAYCHWLLKKCSQKHLGTYHIYTSNEQIEFPFMSKLYKLISIHINGIVVGGFPELGVSGGVSPYCTRKDYSNCSEDFVHFVFNFRARSSLSHRPYIITMVVFIIRLSVYKIYLS